MRNVMFCCIAAALMMFVSLGSARADHNWHGGYRGGYGGGGYRSSYYGGGYGAHCAPSHHHHHHHHHGRVYYNAPSYTYRSGYYGGVPYGNALYGNRGGVSVYFGF